MNALRMMKRFLEFEYTVTSDYRYFQDQDFNDFLDKIDELSSFRVKCWGKGKILWRAQSGANMGPHPDLCDSVYPCAYSAERMKPLRYAAKEGRINPKGIPYLYLATTRNTAIAETRPGPGEYFCVGKFKTSKPVKLINCCQSLGNGTNQTSDESTLWDIINKAFSKAITNHDLSAEYVPTQILSERFKRAKYDGILYDSLVGRGRNIALFDINAADLNGDCTVHRVTKMNIKYLLGNVQQPEPL